MTELEAAERAEEQRQVQVGDADEGDRRDLAGEGIGERGGEQPHGEPGAAALLGTRAARAC